ncbi:surf-like protein [Tulasnella sp. 403]|nr:surf-like protein [Tulasnella sp. 403]
MFRPLLRSPCFNRRLGSVQLRWASTYHETAPFNPHAKRKATSWLSPYKLLLGFMPIFTFGLGTWQVQRLQWKLGLIKELEEQLDKEPMELPRIINLAALPEFEWRRVTVRGVWDHAHSVLIGPRVRENQGGYNLVTPLKRPSASTILVDRGFVEKELAEAARDNKLPGILGDEPVEITGMLRLQPKRNAFTPENSPGKGVWYWPDIDQLVQYAGGADAGVQPVLVEAIFEGDVGERLTNMKRGVPIGRSTVVDIRNEHATYAVIW